MKKTIKCLVLGFVVVGFVGCDSISGVFDKFSYDEVFEEVSDNKWKFCVGKGKSIYDYYSSIDKSKYKFIPPSELADEEKGLIGACEWTEFADYNWSGFGYKNDKIKSECKTGQKESGTGVLKWDKESGALIQENKYKVITIAEYAEYSENKDGRGICKKREIYKLKRGQPKE